MKSLAVLIVLVTMAVPMHGRLAQLLPKPQVAELRVGESPFVLKRAVVLHDETHCMLLKKFLTDNGCRLSRGAKAVVRVVIADSVNGAYDYCLPGFENEAYRLDVSHDSIVIQSVTTIGVIRATQTLAQLAETNTSGRGFIEALHIVDWPAFKLRGWMQDVGRSFLPVKELKREIDLLSRFKVNVFHWHLTEKLAWRFEVKAFPTLTRPRQRKILYPGAVP